MLFRSGDIVLQIFLMCCHGYFSLRKKVYGFLLLVSGDGHQATGTRWLASDGDRQFQIRITTSVENQGRLATIVELDDAAHDDDVVAAFKA